MRFGCIASSDAGVKPKTETTLVHQIGESSEAVNDKQNLCEIETQAVETLAGKTQVSWDFDSSVSRMGEVSYFSEFLEANGLFDSLIENCPLRCASNNAPEIREALGTLLLSQRGILDVDTPIKTLYGKQQGALVGYNPHKPGAVGRGRPGMGKRRRRLELLRAAPAAFGLEGIPASRRPSQNRPVEGKGPRAPRRSRGSNGPRSRRRQAGPFRMQDPRHESGWGTLVDPAPVSGPRGQRELPRRAQEPMGLRGALEAHIAARVQEDLDHPAEHRASRNGADLGFEAE